MAQADWTAGNEFSVLIDGVAYPFKSINDNATANMLNRANSKYSPGFSVKKAGNKSLTISGTGPYRRGEAALTLGNEYTVQINKYAADTNPTEETMILASLEWSSDQEDAPNVSVTFESQADFGLSRQ